MPDYNLMRRTAILKMQNFLSVTQNQRSAYYMRFVMGSRNYGGRHSSHWNAVFPDSRWTSLGATLGGNVGSRLSINGGFRRDSGTDIRADYSLDTKTLFIGATGADGIGDYLLGVQYSTRPRILDSITFYEKIIRPFIIQNIGNISNVDASAYSIGTAEIATITALLKRDFGGSISVNSTYYSPYENGNLKNNLEDLVGSGSYEKARGTVFVSAYDDVTDMDGTPNDPIGLVVYKVPTQVFISSNGFNVKVEYFEWAHGVEHVTGEMLANNFVNSNQASPNIRIVNRNGGDPTLVDSSGVIQYLFNEATVNHKQIFIDGYNVTRAIINGANAFRLKLASNDRDFDANYKRLTYVTFGGKVKIATIDNLRSWIQRGSAFGSLMGSTLGRAIIAEGHPVEETLASGFLSAVGAKLGAALDVGINTGALGNEVKMPSWTLQHFIT